MKKSEATETRGSVNPFPTNRLLVLHVLPDLRQCAGGIAGAMRPLERALALEGISSHFLTLRQDADSPLKDRTHLIAGSRYHILANLSSIRRSIERVAEMARQRGLPLVCHSHGLWSPINHVIVRHCRGQGIPVVISVHGMLMPWAKRHKAVRKAIAWWLYQHDDLNRADAIHVTSNEELSNVDRAAHIRRPCVAPFGVYLPPEVKGVPMKIAPDELRSLLFFGRLHPIKNIPTLLQAFSQANLEGWRLRIVGPDEAGHRKALESEVARLKLGGKTTIEDAVFGAAKDALFRSVDALVLPSHSENYGAVVAEALAYGRPVIASRGTPWAALEREECGWWVNPDRDSLISALERLGQTAPNDLQAMGMRGRDLIERSLTWESSGASHADLYERALTRSLKGYV